METPSFAGSRLGSPVSRAMVLALTALVIAGACSRTSPGPVDPASASYLEVQNQSFWDMNIYLIRSGGRTRLGSVPGKSTRVLTIPEMFVSPGIQVQFMADPIGSSRTPYSQSIDIAPRETIVLVIPPTS